MRICAATLAIAFATMPAAAETRYKAIVHILQTDGEYVRYELAATANGISRMECKMRADAWKAKMSDAITTALGTLQEQGKSGDMRIACERAK